MSTYSDDELRSLGFELPADTPVEKNIRHDEINKFEDWLIEHGPENYLVYTKQRRDELDTA